MTVLIAIIVVEIVAVGIALARKLLAALGWLLDLDETNEDRRLVLFIPLSLSPELTTSIALS